MACSGEKKSSPCQPDDDYVMIESTDCAFIFHTCQQEIKHLKTKNEHPQSQVLTLEDQTQAQQSCQDELARLQQIISEQKKEIDALKKDQPSQKEPGARSEYCVVGNVEMAKEKSHDDIAVIDTQHNLRETEHHQEKKEKNQNETRDGLKHYTDKLAQIEAELRKSKEQLSDAQAELKRSNDKLKKTEAELDVTKTRLSKAMGAKLTDNNPNIADLSDKNRPTKLAEKYQELYDNQWTDAYEITESIYKTEREGSRNAETKAISILIKILMETKQFCEDEAASQTSLMQKAIILERMPKGKDKCIPQAVLKQIKDFRKKVAVFSGKQIFKKYQDKLSQSTTSTAEVAKIAPKFVEECFEMCWLMTVQDPPLAFGPNIKRGDRFDTDMYKAYTKSGRKIDFVVWPTLLLHQNGPVLSKGIAQGLVEDDGHKNRR